MNPILLAVGNSADALRLAPLAGACKDAGLTAHVGFLGDPTAAAPLTALGLRAPDRSIAVPAGTAVERLAAAIAGYGAILAAHRPAAVVVQGHGLAARGASLAASAAGIPVVRLGAGLRAHDDSPDERDRQALDRLSHTLLAPSAEQDLNLRREQFAATRVAVAGSTLAAALRALPDAPKPAAAAKPRGHVWLALERTSTADDSDALRAILAGTAAGAAKAGLTVLAAEGMLAGAMQRHELIAPAGLQLASKATPRDELELLRSAAAVVTDCADHQELACVLGVPCVTARAATPRPETIDRGCNRVAGTDAQAIERAITIALAGPREWPSPYADAVPAVVAALRAAAAPAAAPAAKPAVPAPAAGPKGPVLALPSDGDWTGRTLGAEEVEIAGRAIRSGTLNSTKGTFVTRLEQEFARFVGRKHAIACASGTAAVHCAIAALNLKAGDEVITTPITDMGALTPILYEGAIPVFADVDPVTINVTADTIRAQLTDRTKAIVVTHLFGLACDMDPIMALAQERGIPVIEDVAQAFQATDKGRRVGTFGQLATFSLQQGKHMTTGEGGVVATDDQALARRVFLFVNKAWGYGDPKPDHYFPALNYRLTELQGAVAIAQLQKLDWVVQRRREVASALGEKLREIPGLLLPKDPEGGHHTWWKYAFFVDPDVVAGGAVELGKRMKERGVFCVPRYIQKPAFECQLFQDFDAHPVTRLPLEHSARRGQKQPLFDRADYPGTVRALDRVIVLPINELYEHKHVEYVADVIRDEARVLAHA